MLTHARNKIIKVQKRFKNKKLFIYLKQNKTYPYLDTPKTIFSPYTKNMQ